MYGNRFDEHGQHPHRGHGPHGHGGGPGGERPRFRGEFPFGPGGFPFGGPGGFGPPGPRGRGPWGGRGGRGGRARRGNVRASILALLKDRPMHGYEIIQEIGERTQGAWKPSPGSVYPTLQLLEDEGKITTREEGGKRLSELTDAGREEAEEGPDAPWEEAGRDVDFEALHEVRTGVGQLMQALHQVMATGTEEQRAKAMETVNDARKQLYRLLAED